MTLPRARRLRALGCALMATLAAALQLACAFNDTPLRFDKPIVLLGETHDNARHHEIQRQALQAMLDSGARPALLMEQFDRERQGDIDRALAAGADVAGLIAAGSGLAPGAAQSSSQWQWRFYEPLIALALRYRLPVVAANVSRADARKIIADGLAAHDFDARVPTDVETSHAADIERSHCGLINAAMARRMAAAQIARDQFMARVVQLHAARGAVLIAGAGHTRRDVGVPRWLPAAERARTEAIGLLEDGAVNLAGAFDRVIVTPPQPRADPCASMRRSG
jgi:uncharacterized iron-regulated protein